MYMVIAMQLTEKVGDEMKPSTLLKTVRLDVLQVFLPHNSLSAGACDVA